MFEGDKVMFEIYRDSAYSDEFRVVFYTELDEHNKDAEINRAMAGEHFFDGYILSMKKERAKQRIASILERLNAGEEIQPEKVEDELAEFLVR
jgi:putative component of toxin-antitoxin plasmid stabilization module